MAIEPIDGFSCPAATLSGFLGDLLQAAGAGNGSAEAVARAVVDASSRGVDTHGVRLVPWYLQMLEGGRINRTPDVTFTQKAAAVGHVDADDGFGHLASFRAIEEGIAMARSSGVAAITVGRSTHHGATGVYALAAARAGFAAIGMTHADPAVVPFGGTTPFYGTNPISFAVPAPGEEPMLLDMATSSIPYNRIFLRRATGTQLPPEVAVTKDGTPTLDPFAATAVLPLGGAGFGYKGAGLAAMVDILCSAFSGMGHGATIDPLAGSDYGKPIPIGHFFLILMPAHVPGGRGLRRAHRRVPGRPAAAAGTTGTEGHGAGRRREGGSRAARPRRHSRSTAPPGRRWSKLQRATDRRCRRPRRRRSPSGA